MRTFLGVPVQGRGEVFGNLYRQGRGAEFTEDDEAVVSALVMAAWLAIENARFYEESQRQRRWLQASGELTARADATAEAEDY